MNDATSPFAFSQFVPGFDFLKNLAGGATPSAGGVGGMPSLSNWVAPTLSVEEVDKRIQELKTVQYWLEQNGHALKATIQALEVQKMTLSTLRGMNVQMEDLAKAFTRSATAASQATAAPASSADTEPQAESPPSTAAAQRHDAAPASEGAEGDLASDGAPAAAPGVVDPLQWWNALTQQFQHIAQTTLQDAAQLKMPAPLGGDAAAQLSPRAAPSARKAAAKKTTAKKPAPARKAAPAPRARSR